MSLGRRLVGAALGLFVLSGFPLYWLIFRGEHPATGSLPVTVIPTTELKLAALPANIQPPSSLTVAPDGSAWAWTNVTGTTTLFHWSPNEPTVSAYPLGNDQFLDTQTGIQNGIVVDNEGTVWMAANLTLVSYNPNSGAVSKVTLPSMPTDGGLDAQLPPGAQSAQTIESLSAGPDGTLAVAVQNAPLVEIFNTATQAFSSIQLPPASDAADVAYSPDGTLAVSQVQFSTAGGPTKRSVLVFSPEGVQEAVAQGVVTTALVPDGEGFLTGAQEFISKSGAMSSVAPATLSSIGTAYGGEPLKRSAILGSSSMAWISASGVVISANGQSFVAKLPTEACSGYNTSLAPPQTGDTPQSAPASGMCTQYPSQIAASTASNGLYILASDGSGIYYLPNSSY